jgi:hypothetical protein
MDTTDLWETLAETMEALAEHHPEIAKTDLWSALVSLQLIIEETAECPNHQGGFDCTPFCASCQGEQEITTN